ncbi:MAG: hypothetical protein EBT07_18375 [Actinobacteria bacterium]|nr:hypothetical protein [Actinomycetota bacterium]
MGSGRDAAGFPCGVDPGAGGGAAGAAGGEAGGAGAVFPDGGEDVCGGVAVDAVADRADAGAGGGGGGAVAGEIRAAEGCAAEGVFSPDRVLGRVRGPDVADGEGAGAGPGVGVTGGLGPALRGGGGGVGGTVGGIAEGEGERADVIPRGAGDGEDDVFAAHGVASAGGAPVLPVAVGSGRDAFAAGHGEFLGGGGDELCAGEGGGAGGCGGAVGLNATDGLMGDFLRVHLVATVNCKLTALDAACRRPGRMLWMREFGRMERERAEMVADRHGLELRGDQRDYSLAEIFHGASKASAEAKVGFA